MDSNKLENGKRSNVLKKSSPVQWTQFVLSPVGEDLLDILQKKIEAIRNNYKNAKNMEEVAKVQGEESALLYNIQLIQSMAELGRRQLQRANNNQEVM